jgi:hypothetical protein
MRSAPRRFCATSCLLNFCYALEERQKISGVSNIIKAKAEKKITVGVQWSKRGYFNKLVEGNVDRCSYMLRYVNEEDQEM